MPADINTFIDCNHLTDLERLAALSFLAHGHAYRIFGRRRPDNLPPGVTWENVATVVSADELTIRRVRWEFLASDGGVWADPDIVCLRPIEIADDFQCVFSDVNIVSECFVKAPANHPVIRAMRRRSRHPVAFTMIHPGTWYLFRPWQPRRAAEVRRRLGDDLDGAGELSRLMLRRRESLEILPPYYFFPVKRNDSHTLYDEPRRDDDPPFDGFGACLFAWKHVGRPIEPESFVGRLLRRYDLA